MKKIQPLSTRVNGVQLAIADIKDMWSTHILRRMVLGLIVIPLLYSFVYLWAFWNPVDYLYQFPLAVVNQDRGYVQNAGTADAEIINIGEQFAGKLTGDQQMDWQLLSLDEARIGLNEEKYYLVVIIPPDFSERAFSASTDHPRAPDLNYEINEGGSYIGATYSRKIMDKIEISLKRELTTRYLEVIFATLANGGQGLDKAANGALILAQGTDQAYAGAIQLHQGLEQSGEGMQQLGDGLEQLSNGANNLENGTVQLNTTVQLVAGSASRLMGPITELVDKFNAFSANYNQVLQSLNHSLGNIDNSLAVMSDLSGHLEQTGQSLNTLNSDLDRTAAANWERQDQYIDALNSDLQFLVTKHPELRNDPYIAALLADVEHVDAVHHEIGSDYSQLQGDVSELNSRLGDTQTRLQESSRQMQSDLAQAREGLQGLQLQPIAVNESKIEEAASELDRLADGTEQLQNGATQLVEGLNAFANGFGQLRSGNGQLLQGSASLEDGLGQISSGQYELASKLAEAAGLMADDGKSAERVEAIANPVVLNENNIHPVPSNGTGFAPYFITLSLWVGSLLLFFAVDLKTVRAMPKTPGSYIMNKYLALASVSVFQALLSIFVLHAGLGIPTVLAPIQLYGFAIITGLSFAAVLFMLISVFGDDIGRFIAVVLMILQLTSCSGSYPIHLQNSFFQFLEPIFPMTYAVNGFKGIISIGTQVMSGNDAFILLGYALASLLIIYVFKRKSIVHEIEVRDAGVSGS